MQDRRFGTNTALSDGNQAGVGGTAGAQYRRMTEAYNRAIRGLRRAFRAGDERAAIQEIAVRQDAMDKGYTPGGIRKKAEFDSGILGRVAAMEQADADAGQAQELARRQVQANIDALNQPDEPADAPADPVQDQIDAQGMQTMADQAAGRESPDYLEDPLQRERGRMASTGKRRRLIPPGYGETPWWERIA